MDGSEDPAHAYLTDVQSIATRSGSRFLLSYFLINCDSPRIDAYFLYKEFDLIVESEKKNQVELRRKNEDGEEVVSATFLGLGIYNWLTGRMPIATPKPVKLVWLDFDGSPANNALVARLWPVFREHNYWNITYNISDDNTNQEIRHGHRLMFYIGKNISATIRWIAESYPGLQVEVPLVIGNDVSRAFDKPIGYKKVDVVQHISPHLVTPEGLGLTLAKLN